jgi:putative addiction module component (TIGR02574 family)
MAADPCCVCRNGSSEHQSGEGEFREGFHIFRCLFEAIRRCRRRTPPVLFCPREQPSLMTSQSVDGFLQENEWQKNGGRKILPRRRDERGTRQRNSVSNRRKRRKRRETICTIHQVSSYQWACEFGDAEDKSEDFLRRPGKKPMTNWFEPAILILMNALAEITEKALALPVEQRIALAQNLWESVEDSELPGIAEERLTEELRQRLGDEPGKDWQTHEQVMEQARREFGWKKK